MAGKSSGALSEANGSRPEAAAARAEEDFVDSTAAAAAAAAENMTGSQSSGVMAAIQGTGAVATGPTSKAQSKTDATGKAGSVKGNSNLNGARAGIGGTAGTASAVSDAHPLIETSAAAGLSVAAQDVTPSALSVKGNDTSAKTSTPIQASLAEGVPPVKAESAASAELEQLANTAGDQNRAAAGLVLAGPGQAAPDAGLMPNGPSQHVPAPVSAAARLSKGHASQQLPVHFPSSSPVNGAKVAPNVAGKAQLLAVPAKTGVAPASIANGDRKTSDEAGQAANVQQKTSPTLLADPQVTPDSLSLFRQFLIILHCNNIICLAIAVYTQTCSLYHAQHGCNTLALCNQLMPKPKWGHMVSPASTHLVTSKSKGSNFAWLTTMLLMRQNVVTMHLMRCQQPWPELDDLGQSGHAVCYMP